MARFIKRIELDRKLNYLDVVQGLVVWNKALLDSGSLPVRGKSSTKVSAKVV